MQEIDSEIDRDDIDNKAGGINGCQLIKALQQHQRPQEDRLIMNVKCKASLLGACVLLSCCVVPGTGFIQGFSPPTSSFFLISEPNKLLNGLRKRSPISSTQNVRSKLAAGRQWEGDDIRWIQRLRRRFSAGGSRTRTPARNVFVILNIIVFSYQVTNSVNYVRRKHPAYWPSEALLIIWDVLLGASITGPFTMDFVHSDFLSRRQPYRYLTAGFLHGGLIHLLVNMDSLLRTPPWLETGLGWSLFVTTFLVGIISGNVWHVLSTLDNSLCLGASGGICGLYGLMFMALIKMGNTQLGWSVLKKMAVLLLYGFIFANVSNAAHIGGFLGGILMGLLCCPSYRKSYSLTRKNSLEVDLADREYRLAMGFGKVPSKRGLIPVLLIWISAFIALASNPL